MRKNKDITKQNLHKLYGSKRRRKFFRFGYFCLDYILPLFTKLIIPWTPFVVYSFLIIRRGYNIEVSEKILEFDLLAIFLPILISFISIIVSSRSEIESGLKYNDIRELNPKAMFSINEMVGLIGILLIICIPTFLLENALIKLVMSGIYVYYAVYILYQEIPYFVGGRLLREYILLQLRFNKKRELRTNIRMDSEIRNIENQLIEHLQKDGEISYWSTGTKIKNSNHSSKIKKDELNNYLFVKKELENRKDDVEKQLDVYNKKKINGEVTESLDFRYIHEDLFPTITSFISNYITLTETCHSFVQLLRTLWVNCNHDDENAASLSAINEIDLVINECFEKIKSGHIDIDFIDTAPTSDEYYEIHYGMTILIDLLLYSIRMGDMKFIHKLESMISRSDLYINDENGRGSITSLGYFYLSTKLFLNCVIYSDNLNYYCYLSDDEGREQYTESLTDALKVDKWNNYFWDLIGKMKPSEIGALGLYVSLYQVGVGWCNLTNSNKTPDNLIDKKQMDHAFAETVKDQLERYNNGELAVQDDEKFFSAVYITRVNKTLNKDEGISIVKH